MKTKTPKKKMKLWKKILITLTVIILVPIITFSVFVIYEMTRDPVKPGEIEEQKVTEYLEVEASDIKKAVVGNITTTPISSKINKKDIIKRLDEAPGFSMAEYYDIEGALEIMNNTVSEKKTDTSVLDENNNVDAQKLYETVLKNNEAAKKLTGKDRLNLFYSDAEPEDIRNICNIVAKTVNETKEDRDITETASALSRLKIFQHKTSTNLAAVNFELIFVYNKSMIDVNEIVRSLSKSTSEKYDDSTLVFVHETEHIKQMGSLDDNKENGIEIGFCRYYDNCNVNSLWDQWLFEGAAEMKMTDYLQVKPMTYAKKISYINSYSVASILNKNTRINALVNSTFDNNLEEACKTLNIKTESEKDDFLKLMYSIQLTQYDCDDFWEYYQKKTGKALSDDEREGLRLEIRKDAIYNLSRKYFANLLKAIENKEIKDLETVFYMLKIWELDCCTHLCYTTKDGFEHAKDYLVWHNDINNLFFKALAEKSDKSFEEIKSEYEGYHPFVKESEDAKEEKQNFRFYNLETEREEYITARFKGYNAVHFTEIEKMAEYMNKEKQ